MDNNLNGQGNGPRLTREWGLRAALVFFGALWLAVIAAHWADASTGDDEYSFNWLDPEKKIYVLQNRRYTKAKRLLLSLMAGPGISNPYRSSFNLDPRLAFYMSEAIGFEAFYTVTSNTANNTFDGLKGTNTPVFPVIREIKSQYGGLVHWVPWYAKINVFNKILYFDWYLASGMGTVHSTVDTNAGGTPNLTVQDMFALFAATGHQYHLTQNFTVRLEFTGAYYAAPSFGTSGGKTWFSNYNFGVGFGLRL